VTPRWIRSRLSWTKKPLRSQVDTATSPNGLSDFSSALIHSASASTTKKPVIIATQCETGLGRSGAATALELRGFNSVEP
jgi:hypothetical protein